MGRNEAVNLVNELLPNLIAPTRKLDTHRSAFGACAIENALIAECEYPTKTGRCFEPVRILVQDADGFPPVVIQDGNHRLAAARAARVESFLAIVTIARHGRIVRKFTAMVRTGG